MSGMNFLSWHRDLGLAAAFVAAASIIPALAANDGSPSANTLKVLQLTGADDKALAKVGISKLPLGDISLPSGRIVAVDPLTLFGANYPFVQTVMPGAYPVTVYWTDNPQWGTRVVLAALTFSDVPVKTWTMALMQGNDVTTLKNGEFFGYGVDAGVGSFIAPESIVAFEADMKKAEESIVGFSDYYSDVLSKPFEAREPNAMIWKPEGKETFAFAMFHSGFGDGFYPSYFGLDENGNPSVLATTFFVLEEIAEQK